MENRMVESILNFIEFFKTFTITLYQPVFDVCTLKVYTYVQWVVNVIATIISGLLNQIIRTYYANANILKLFLFEGHEP